MSSLEDPKRPILEHLDELLKRFRRILLWLFLGFGGAYALSERLLEYLKLPIAQLAPKLVDIPVPQIIVTTPFERIWTLLRLSLYVGIVFVIPFIFYEGWSFASPGLKKHERRKVLWLVFCAAIVFLGGLFVGYHYSLPMVLEAIIRFSKDSQTLNYWTLSAYTNLVVGILLVTAFLCELPVVMSFVSAWGWVKAREWGSGRRLFLIVNAVIAALLSPPDVISMLVMMVPIQILYEIGIVFSHVAQWWHHEE
jgi:sec-independent protein translocase protein TatC